jgi:dolichol-phosphate mannosyltransferase
MYNESLNAEKCIIEVDFALSQLGRSGHLIVVQDGSTDNTNDILVNLKKRYNFTLVSKTTNHGYGRALVAGVSEAAKIGAKYVLFMDSDLTNSPKDIAKFVECMEQDYDIIKATRYSNNGKVVGVPFYRYIISYLGNKCLSVLMGCNATDITNGFRAVKITLLENIVFNENKFEIITEEYSKIFNKKLKVANVGVILTNRDEKIRKTSFVYSPIVFWRYVKYPLIYFITNRIFNFLNIKHSR